MRSTIEARLFRRSLAPMLAGVLAASGSTPWALAQNNDKRNVGAGRTTSAAAPSGVPIVRIQLMGDVSSVTLACSSGLTIRSAGSTQPGRKQAALSQLRVEVRRDSARTSERIVKAAYSAAPLLVAMDSDRVVALGEEDLVISAADSPEGNEAEKVDGGAQKPKRGYDFARATRQNAEPNGPARRAEAQPGLPIRVGGKLYWGEIRLILNRRGLMNVINAVPIEDYLRGVVPLELSPLGFPEIEALKAQAVAARSYALFHRGEHDDEGYDLRDDARSQVYGGVAAEHELSDRAVEETRGVVATAPGEDGHWVPIDAMYSANCGGHTENNEDVFGGKARSYLRGVACEVDRSLASGREIDTSRKPIFYFDQDGRSVTREVSLLQVLGFALPRQVGSRYLASPAEGEELKSWSERAARISFQPAPPVAADKSLSGFAELAAASVYGEGRASVLITPGDASYILSGLDLRESRQAESRGKPTSQPRASLALLVKTGALRLPTGGAADLSAPVARAVAISTFARALLNRARESRPGSSTLKTVSRRPDGELRSDITNQVEDGRLVVDSQGPRPDASLADSRGSRGYVKVEASARANGTKQERPKSSQQTDASPQSSTPVTNAPPRLEVAKDAWLFRNLAGESYQVDRLTLIGGEQIVYHLDRAGRIDFIEVSPSDRSAAVDRFSRVASWQERVTADELAARLARRKTEVGRPQSVTPVDLSASGRVRELEIVGTGGRSRLRGSQIKSVLGLRENLFVVDPETDDGGRVVAFVFTGRGWGHGVGMCQTGAYGLAREGYSYKAILQTYYTGIRLQKIY